MPINQDTHYVIKNGIVEQPAVVKDGLELYYDAKGKHNSDVHKGTLLDLSGNNRHGTLVNFAYEGVSGYQENGTGGILLDDVDDKIVRPAIPNIQYTSASRNLFNETLITLPTKVINSENYWIVKGINDGGTASITLRNMFKENTQYTVQYLGVVTTYFNMLVFSYTDGTKTTKSFTDGVLSNFTSAAGKTIDYLTIDTGSTSTEGYIKKNTFQLEEGVSATSYTPYVPLPIMTYQMNGNILSFEKDGTVKRTTKDANGNRITVSRKGINLVRNGNFYNGASGWQYGTIKAVSHSENSAELEVLSPGTQWIQPSTLTYLAATNGHKIYACLYTTNTSNESSTNLMINAGVTQTLTSSGKKEGWTKLEGIATLSGQTNGQLIRMYNGHIFSSAEVSIGQRFFIKNFQIIDLTEAYGAGNEPDLTYIQAHPEEFSWTPNPNDLIQTVEIKNNLVGDLENLQGNDFEQHEDGIVTYTSEAEAGSVVRVDIDGISEQPLRFRSTEGEQLVITEHDTGDSIKKIEFYGNSVQLADKYREVSGTSVAVAPELHDKNVADKLVIGGNTYQYTESSNVVTDGLQMWLSGRNFSNSPATNVWKDLTGMNNGTASGFAFKSASGSDGNGGVVFDGVDDRVVFNSLNTLKNGQITCEMSLNVKRQKSSGWQSFFGGTLGFSFSIGILPTSFKLGATLTNHVDAQASAYTFQLNTDVHVVVTYSTFTKILKYYINGVLITTVNNAFSGAVPTGSTNEIGAHSSVGTGALDGNVKFARIYNRALSDAEVLQNYNAGLAIPLPNIAMPQEVKHVNSGSKVLVYGKNLLNPAIFNTQGGRSGTIGATVEQNLINTPTRISTDKNSALRLAKGTTYTFTIPSGMRLGVHNYSISEKLTYDSGWRTSTYVYTTPSYDYSFTVLTLSNGLVSGKTEQPITPAQALSLTNLQLEIGSTATTYEPFTQAETTIPVTLKSIG